MHGPMNVKFSSEYLQVLSKIITIYCTLKSPRFSKTWSFSVPDSRASIKRVRERKVAKYICTYVTQTKNRIKGLLYCRDSKFDPRHNTS